jgi:hypothetical protein
MLATVLVEVAVQLHFAAQAHYSAAPLSGAGALQYSSTLLGRRAL